VDRKLEAYARQLMDLRKGIELEMSQYHGEEPATPRHHLRKGRWSR
jgi:hypothetical protein